MLWGKRYSEMLFPGASEDYPWESEHLETKLKKEKLLGR